GLSVEKLIPFMLIRVRPSSNSTTFTLVYEISSIGDIVTKATLIGIGLDFVVGLFYFFLKFKLGKN
ncbi:MAG: hypothetical protein QXY91_05215, partial [Thermoproteota archaeon]